MSPAAMPTRAVPVRVFRATLRAALRAVEAEGQRLVLTRHGRPVAALVPVATLDAPPGDETPTGPTVNRPPEVSVPSPAAGAQP